MSIIWFAKALVFQLLLLIKNEEYMKHNVNHGNLHCDIESCVIHLRQCR